MASAITNLSAHDSSAVPDASSMKFGIVVSEYNSEITSALLDGCSTTLKKYNAGDDAISIHFVPGAFELPCGAKLLVETKKIDAIVCIGCVIKGETKHDDFINHAIANGMIQLSIQSGIPVIFGVLTPNNLQQAKDRAGGKHGNKGVEAAVAAIKMVDLKREVPSL